MPSPAPRCDTDTRRLNAWIVRDALLEAYGARDLHPRNEPIYDALDALESCPAAAGSSVPDTSGQAHPSINLAAILRYADDADKWRAGQKTEDELLQRIWNLVADVRLLAAEVQSGTTADSGGLQAPASGLPAVREPDEAARREANPRLVSRQDWWIAYGQRMSGRTPYPICSECAEPMRDAAFTGGFVCDECAPYVPKSERPS